MINGFKGNSIVAIVRAYQRNYQINNNYKEK